MKYFTLLIFLSLSIFASGQCWGEDLRGSRYKITKTKVIGFSVLVASGFIDGFVEGFTFTNRRYFERRFDVDPLGFWGSKSYKRIKTHPNIWNKNMGVFDFYHVMDDLRKIGYITGGVVITLGVKQKPKHILLDVAISLVVSGLGKRAGLYLVRQH